MNLLLVVLIYMNTIHVYCMTNFKLISIKQFTDHVTTISYSPHLKKILIGGFKRRILILNPVTFQVENRFSDQRSSDHIHTIEYVPKHDIIVAATKFTVYIYDTSLNLIQEYSPPRHFGSWEPFPCEIFAISKDRILVPRRYQNQKILFLLKKPCLMY